jgi:hypothetical protein
MDTKKIFYKQINEESTCFFQGSLDSMGYKIIQEYNNGTYRRYATMFLPDITTLVGSNEPEYDNSAKEAYSYQYITKHLNPLLQ